ncbi:benzoate O-methyltransferase isoform X3 [Sorghum bicolor]|uniref:benzoate O-methyltransferase isoform X3 n=1 Tax=Sorghum bicolor TaxID=4558 RepID=UPI000B4266A9|nr:benzoate O-methyltransferase isoform X3 [Sorghum bicolor]|eukprot:XP_021308636.1 benzoate O-methyltransferase isoform X3 [Sorghum bicolor]
MKSIQIHWVLSLFLLNNQETIPTKFLVMMTNLQRDFHMAEGNGEHSYAKNSRAQEKLMVQTTPIVEDAIKEVCTALVPKTMVIADLGCSSGPNTLLFISNVINIIAGQCNKSIGECDPVELQIFLNDLPGNDFNQLFSSLENLKHGKIIEQMGYTPPLYYISGLPKSYYNRLFPRRSVHLFHSACCLHWRSQVPEELHARNGTPLNKDNIYITKTTPSSVVKCFQEQFNKDFSLFLKLRHEELVYGGKMVLTFVGRKDEDVYNGDMNQLYGLLARSLQSLVAKAFSYLLLLVQLLDWYTDRFWRRGRDKGQVEFSDTRDS